MRTPILLYKGKAKDFKLDKCQGYDIMLNREFVKKANMLFDVKYHMEAWSKND